MFVPPYFSEVCPDDLYMFTDFYTSFLFDKNLHEGMHIAVNSLRLDWEYPSLSRIDLYDLNFTDISWTFYVLYMHYGLKIDMPSTCQIVGVWYLLSKISIKIGTNSSDVL